MPRQARKNLNTPFLHVMVQGVNKEYIFYKNEYIDKYLEIVHRNKKNYNFNILAYCIMNNHAHFLVYTEDIHEFGKFMQKTNLVYAQMYNKSEKRCGVLFRNRYQTEPIFNEHHLINCIKYIHNNPVKAKIVKRCCDYKYSSYNDYINNRGATQTQVMKDLFGTNCNYLQLFEETYEKKYMDIADENSTKIDVYIQEGVTAFIKKENIELTKILSNREILKKLIYFLKENWGLKYADIGNYFEISKGTMNNLKLNKKSKF